MTSDPVTRFLAVRAAGVERRARLRPLTSSEVLDSSLGVARNLGGQLLRVSLVPSLFCMASLVFLVGYVLPTLTYTKTPDSTTNQMLEAIIAIAVAVFVGGSIFLLGATYAGAVVIRLTSDFILGLPAEAELSEFAVRDRLGAVFLCGLRELFICFGGLLGSAAILLFSGLLTMVTSPDNPVAGVFATIGGIAMAAGCLALLIVFAKRAVMFPIVVLEGVGIKEAGARMKRLMKPNRYEPNGSGAIGGLYGVSILTFGVITLGVYSAFEFFGVDAMVRSWTNHSMLEPLLATAVQLIPVLCAIWVLLPYWAIVMTVLYYERRIRVEGFDIEQLAEEIGRSGRTNRFNV